MATQTEIILNAQGWQSKSDFYTSYMNVTDAPQWFGRNLDAFHDSLRGGICKITPDKIIIRNLTTRIKECIGLEFWNSIMEICQDEDVQLEVHGN